MPSRWPVPFVGRKSGLKRRENGTTGKRVEEDDAIQETRVLLADGKILAIKGLGGFHLACDATNADAVKRTPGPQTARGQALCPHDAGYGNNRTALLCG